MRLVAITTLYKYTGKSVVELYKYTETGSFDVWKFEK